MTLLPANAGMIPHGGRGSAAVWCAPRKRVDYHKLIYVVEQFGSGVMLTANISI